jgi:hypothetical protein
MRNILKVVAGVVIGASLMSLYHFVVRIQSQESQLHLEIVDQTSKPVKKVTVTTGQIKPEDATFTNLDSGDKIYYSRSFGGEGTSRLHLEFEDGNKLDSREIYVEGGYTMVYTLFDDTIHVD